MSSIKVKRLIVKDGQPERWEYREIAKGIWNEQMKKPLDKRHPAFRAMKEVSEAEWEKRDTEKFNLYGKVEDFDLSAEIEAKNKEIEELKKQLADQPKEKKPKAEKELKGGSDE